MDFDDYQDAADTTDQRRGASSDAVAYPVLGLASEIGSLVTQFKKRVRDGDPSDLFAERASEILGDILWYSANLATKLDLRLGDVAQNNLRRIHERWPTETPPHPARFLDDDFPDHERLPRQLTVDFVEETVDDRTSVRIYRDGEPLGDPLYDMAWESDDYRYHDAVHLTFVGLLGWSPIARAYLGVQRRSDPRLREIEDAGRAKIIEEAVVALAFEHARNMRFLHGATQVDSSLLRTVQAMTAGLEVRIRTPHDWERALLRAFEMWRALREHRGGSLHVDMHARAVEFSPPAGGH